MVRPGGGVQLAPEPRKKKVVFLLLTQLETSGEFLRSDDPDMIAGAEFLAGFFPLFDKMTGLKYLPLPGGPRDQPADLMDIRGRLGRAIAKAPTPDD